MEGRCTFNLKDHEPVTLGVASSGDDKDSRVNDLVSIHFAPQVL